MSEAALRVAARFQQRVAGRLARRFMADQPPGQRKRVHDISRPINKPKGIDRKVVREEAKTEEREDTIEPNKRDVQPKDVFNPPLPRNVAVRDFAETGKDMSKALDKQIPKDKGHETVNNLSQYLIETGGGGEGGPEGKKKK